MTGADGQLLKRPDSEEPIEHDDVCHFFAATLADLDPFVGRDDRHGFDEPVAGWGGRESFDFGRVRAARKQREWMTAANKPDDTLVLWPTRAELHEAYDSGVISWDELVVARLVASHCGHEHRLKVAAIEAGGCP